MALVTSDGPVTSKGGRGRGGGRWGEREGGGERERERETDRQTDRHKTSRKQTYLLTKSQTVGAWCRLEALKTVALWTGLCVRGVRREHYSP